MDMPTTKYAATLEGVHIAYQVAGHGPPDLVFVPSALSHIEAYWEEPSVARYLTRLASFSRLIMFDKRGMGMSDRIEGTPTLEARMDDVPAVMDAAGSERAFLCGTSEGGAIAAIFAATYPERVHGLVLFNAAVRNWLQPEIQPSIDDCVRESWGTGGSIDIGAPSVAGDELIRSWGARVERLAASPTTVAAIMKMNSAYDARPVLPTISVPTLVLHCIGDRLVSVEQGRESARLIPGSRYVELGGTDHLPFFESPEVSLGLLEEFVTGERHPVEVDRVLATVVFNDIVGSTALASEMGDRRWKETLDTYYGVVQRAVARFRGRLVKTTGDGTLMTFDGPGRAIRCALVVRDHASTLGLELRSGCHTGEIALREDDVTGIAVVIGQRIAALAERGELLASSTVKDLVAGSGIEFRDRGEPELKGVPGTWRIFAVEG
jgi:pimeloyl-ACP methyl ester carboxylesterase